jgi:monoamine oxidase
MPQLPTSLRSTSSITRRAWLSMIGRSAGAGAMLRAMGALGLAAPSAYAGLPDLQGAPPGTRVLVLGAGMAGLVAAEQLRRAGYTVQVLEYAQRAGGRAWTLRGGDPYTELGGATQRVGFDPGLYFNPGPWRIPYHHHGVLDLAHRLGVRLEPFIQVNHNAYLHSARAFGGKPQRFAAVQGDFDGHIAELLAKAARQAPLDDTLTTDDQARLLDALRQWGALDQDGRYRATMQTAERRGPAVLPGGGLMPLPEPSSPVALRDLLRSGLWQRLSTGHEFEFQSTLLQPVGGMDRIVQALYTQVASVVQFGQRVTAIAQDSSGVRVQVVDAAAGGAPRVVAADWCVCTLPLSVLGQLDVQVGPAMRAAIEAVPYEAAVKVGLQFRRRFWEQDDRIYGGISFTDLPIQTIGYPSTGFGQQWKAVLLGAYIWGPNAYEFTAQPPAMRVKLAVDLGARIHPQYPQEFDTGVAVAWHRVPGALGCFANWQDDVRDTHYRNLCQIDGRIVLAGEHASMLPAWQEGALLSSLDAITRLHQRVKAGA